MGHDLTLQALKMPSLLIDRLMEGVIDPELLVFVDYYFTARRQRGSACEEFLNGAPERVLFVDALEQMLNEEPAIVSRCCHLNRQYSWLHMTLELVPSSFADGEFATWAVLGEKQIVPNAKSTQGFRIMWNTPQACELIDAWLADIDEPKVRAACNIDFLRETGSYKIQQTPDDEFVLETVLRCFRLLKDFYKAVVYNKNGVLVDKD